jgi:3-hydroxyisobutyrate dehydrogenase
VAENNTTIAVLGTGIMGAAMARNLLAAGMEVRVWNRTREKAEPLADDGAKVAESPAEAAEGADFVLTMLADAHTVAEAVEGGDALSALAEDGVWLQTSTVGIQGHERLAGIADGYGAAYVDVPVLGTKEPAEQGQLIVLASGPEEVRERCQPIFDAIGSATFWLGPAGIGTRLKLVTNTWIVGILGVLAQMKGQMMIEEEFPTSFSANLARKDASLVLDAADANGLHLSLIEAAADHFDEAINAGYGEEDMAAVYKAVKPEG